MTRRARSLSVAVVVVGVAAAIVVAASSGARAASPIGHFKSLRSAASSVSRGCASQAGLGLPAVLAPDYPPGLAVVTGSSRSPVVSAVWGRRVTSSTGAAMPLPNHVGLVALWPCRHPVVFYQAYETGGQIWMQPVGSATPLAVGSVGSASTAFAFDTNGNHIPPPPSPVAGWTVSGYAPSPDESVSGVPSAYLEEVVRPCRYTGADIYTQADTGRLYVVTPSGRRKLESYDSCTDSPVAAWSPDGSRILWTTVTGFRVADASGRYSRALFIGLGNVSYVNWSPDGRRVAYSVCSPICQVDEIEVATGNVRHLAHIHAPTPPPSQWPGAWPVGWSPDSKRALILERKLNGSGSSVLSVPAAGGKPTVAIHLGR